MKLHYTLHITHYTSLIILFLLICGLSAAVALDSYSENFDNRQDNTTIDAVDSWSVSQGATTNAITQSGVTASGSGKSLKLAGALTTVNVARPASYGSLSPTWIRYSVMPSASSQNQSVPSSGIGAVCFSYNGKVLAANGSSWVDTGMTYTVGEWYDVAMKLNFTTHRYDLYVSSRTTPKVQFLPIKSGLTFIDTSLNSLSKVKFYGSYSTTSTDDVYIDDVSVVYFYRLEFVSSPQKLMLGQASNAITVQLQNSNSEPQTAISNITLDLKSTSGQGKFSLNRQPWSDVGQVVIQKNSQSATFYYKDTVTGKPIITVSEYPDEGFTDATQQQDIVAQVSYFDVEVTTPKVAGENFILKLSAKNEDGTSNEFYSGEVNIKPNYVSPTTGTSKITPNTASGFVNGKIDVTASYPDCGLLTITATDSQDSTKTGTSSQIRFLPASFVLSIQNNLQTVSKAFTLALTAKNTQGITTPNYNSNVNLYPVAVSPLDISKSLLSPAAILGSDFTSGVANVNIAYNLYGTIKLRAEDSNDPTKQGISSEITFLPKALSVSVAQPAGRDFFYIGEPITIIVKVIDELGNPIPNYPGLVELSSGFGLTLPTDYTFISADAGQHKFSSNAVQAGTYTVTAKAEKGLLKADSLPITVKNATLQVIDTTALVGTGKVLIQLIDDLGNIITSESNLSINVSAVEDIANNTASLPSGAITLTEGRATIPVYDSEAELVTIIPSSPFQINVVKGTITFGQAGQTGINILMWKELKEGQ